ncbi:MAG: C25 family cysteine peptidase [Anaerolineaceae bacterium]|nr:C25 family cysteine peptidase [Anaerolineaceae bacterium]
MNNKVLEEQPQCKNSEGPEVISKVEDIFTELARKFKNPEISKSDGRFPMYVIFSSKKGIIEKYGRQTFSVMDFEMKRLASAIQKKPGWGAITFYPDDAGSAVHFGLTAIDSVDPWNLKLSIADLDKFLAKKGSMIGALLIVGGPDIVPFHNLPNPTEDMDEEVASDNPYSTVDANYFVPEWPVGRLPGDSDNEPGLLLEQLRKLISNHSQVDEELPWWMRLLRELKVNVLWSRLFNKKLVQKTIPSFGYSAAVWRRSSAEVYKSIGEVQTMLTSPPESSGSFDPGQIYRSKLAYFNLHGVEDGSSWYGQREIGGSTSGPDYPVAITPENVIKNGHSPKVVFTEACYGGHILNKKENEALALRFIGIGTSAFIGSTCISYGSVREPLIAADLLGYLFWKNICDDYLAGDALVRAKVEYVREMNKRQGFLDGEDQKTLISFVLFGDPLENIDFQKPSKKRALRMKMQPAVNMMQRQKDNSEEKQTLSEATLMEVKMAVEPYLPGIDQADVRISHQYLICDAEFKNCYIGSSLGKQHPSGVDGNKKQVVVTIRKEVKSANINHYHYVRAKLDSSGNLIGLAVSR